MVFIGGRSGTGKTSVGFEMHAQLSAAGVTHCLIDGDFLDMAYPVPSHVDDLAERNLAAMWANYRALGYHRMIYINTASVLPEVMERLTTAMGGNPTVVSILLTCTDATARVRLGKREIGSTLEQHLESSNEMNARLESGVAAATHRGLLHDQVTSELACPGWVSWKDVSMARPYPREFRDDVVRVARDRDDGVTIEQIATDFGVHPVTLHKWMRQADIDEGAKPGKRTGESAELRDARRRIKLLEQENEVLRRAAAYLSQANLPGKGSTRS
ncbi:hypothetical protein MFTT_30940 [Mycolicibacterium fortuitum subsp. fortuitum]|nr:Mobile element protein [Mycobacterium sp. VKM Ac-1817D]BDD99000.1 hypothetical protein MFTT_30940 [Mycolicibacterium fortuitum subsp. fortuitum]